MLHFRFQRPRQPLPPFPQMVKNLCRRTKEGFLSGWYFQGDENSRNRVWHLTYNYTANIIANLVGGNFYTGLMLLLGANDGFVGLMSMITYAANLMQCLSPLLLERFSSRKRLLIGIRLITLFFNVVFIGLVPFFDVGQQFRLTLFGFGVLMVQFTNALTAPGYNIWHIQFLPQRVRVRYFSLLSMTNGILVACFNLLGSAVVDHFKAQGSELIGLTVLRVFALLVTALDIYALSQMKEYPYSQNAKRFTLKDLLISPFKEVKYLRTIGIAFIWNMAANIPGSYYTVYLLKNLDVSYSFITLANFLNVPILLLLMPVWSRFLRKFSWLKTLNIALALYAPHYILLGLITKGSVYYLYPLTLAYAFTLSVGINLAFTNVPYINMPEKNQTVFIGFYSTMANLGALIGVTIGRQLVEGLHAVNFQFLGLTFVDKQVLVLIVGVVMALTAVIVYFLRRGVKEEA